MCFDSRQFLCVGGDVAEADRGEAGAGEVEGGDVGLHVPDTPGVLLLRLAGQHSHPASAGEKIISENIFIVSAMTVQTGVY